ncbi:MAG: hypothetical protein A2X35_02165 [Elusimicrobia bacterium GWA2_61_42]|nr:MAG: hypothetical protein A2X35_02165 [Elusimicrobia bacterium GWA2_61_42]OGR79859.1 MAG: hypothetical protein A2X38_12175 [Elusimicrobia bacterium GWC2_61_25]
MNSKLNITRILSLSVLLLLPAFAAAGQRKAVKKAALPRLVSDGAAFRPFSKPATGAGSTTTQDGGEAMSTEVNGAQSTGGAGVSVGVGIVQNQGGVQNTGTSRAGAAGGGGKTSSAGSSATASPASAAAVPSGVIIAKWTAGPFAADPAFATGQSYALEFMSGTDTSIGSFSTCETTSYGDNHEVAISQSPGDFSGTDITCHRVFGPLGGHLSYVTDSGTKAKQPGVYCFLKPSTKYYINLRFIGSQARQANWSLTDEWKCMPQYNRCDIHLGHSPQKDATGPAPIISNTASPTITPTRPTPMTSAEKIEWFCSLPENQDANCRGRATALLPYISDYAKYPGLDVRGDPLDTSLPCGGFSPCNE